MAADACADHAPDLRERRMLDLGPDELFVVGAFRAWAAPLMRPGRPHPDWRELFGLARVSGSGAVGFELLMSVLGSSAQRLLEVRCCNCPALGPDEAAMLRLVAALQARDTPGALGVLSDWLPPGSIAPALRGACRFAEAAAAAGFRLAEPDMEPDLADDLPCAALTLH